MATTLALAWRQLGREIGLAAAQSQKIYQQLTIQYTAPQRFYHNLAHIHHCLQIAHQLQLLAQDFIAVQLAIWFHDVVYDTQAHDNEEQSATYARKALTPSPLSPQQLNRIEQLILVTKHHQAAADDIDAHIMLDADLAILSASPTQYQQYAQAIRHEYAWVPAEQFRRGRCQVLTSFLARKKIYLTPNMKAREAAARHNLQTEIKDLACLP